MGKIETNLLEEFSHVQKLLSKYQLWHNRKFGPSGDPHRGQGRVLALLRLQPEISQKELGYLLDMRNQSLGELLGKLEKTGAIMRESSDEDRRSMNIKLTESGARLAEQAGHKPDDISRVFDCLGTEDKSKLHEILNRLSCELEKLLGSDETEARAEKNRSEAKHRHGDSGTHRGKTIDGGQEKSSHRSGGGKEEVEE